LVVIDDSDAWADLSVRCGLGRRGASVPGHAPDGLRHGKTLVAGLRVEEVVASGVVDRLTVARLPRLLRPSLMRTLYTGDIVVVDDLSCHKTLDAQHATVAVCTQLWYIPKDSPDLSLVKLCFAMVKAIVHTARCWAHAEICRAIGTCLPRFDAA
jgi:hypothetical protein